MHFGQRRASWFHLLNASWLLLRTSHTEISGTNLFIRPSAREQITRQKCKCAALAGFVGLGWHLVMTPTHLIRMTRELLLVEDVNPRHLGWYVAFAFVSECGIQPLKTEKPFCGWRKQEKKKKRENLSDENLVNHFKRISSDSRNVLQGLAGKYLWMWQYLDYVGGVIHYRDIWLGTVSAPTFTVMQIHTVQLKLDII